MRGKSQFILFAGIVLSLFISLSFVSAGVSFHSVTPTIYVNRTVNTVINFTLNYTGNSNITQVIMQLPPEAVFYANSNGTNAPIYNFTNQSGGFGGGAILTWSNATAAVLIANGSRQSFWFNMSFTRTVTTGGGFMDFSNVTIMTNDTTGTTIQNKSAFVVNFAFTSFVKNETGGNASNVNISMYSFIEGTNGPPTETLVANVLSGADGNFTFPSLNGSISMFKLKMIQYGNGSSDCTYGNGTTCNATKIGSSLPAFPPQMYYPMTTDMPAFAFMIPPSFNGTTFYLNPATTLRLIANNITQNQTFGYEVVDQAVGFPTDSNFMASVRTIDIVVPTGRNYTVMFTRMPGFGGVGYPFSQVCDGNTMNDTACPSPPVSNSSLGSLPEGQILTVNQSLNINNYRLTGCVNTGNNNNTPLNITNIQLKMVPWAGFVPPMKADRGDINLTSDINYTGKGGCSFAFYNISVMGAVSGLQYLLEVYAKNASDEGVNPGNVNLMAAFKNVSISGDTNSNITLKKLAGGYLSGGLGTVNSSSIRINIQNSTGGAITNNLNANIKVKNPAFGTMNYMIESMTSGTFYVRILNDSSSAKVLIYPNDAPPKEIAINLSRNDLNITLTTMADGRGIGMRKINESSGEMRMISSDELNSSTPLNLRFLKSSGGCSGLVPGSDCAITSMEGKSFNPLKALVAGKVNMEMKITSTNVTITFANYDMFSAKQPPMDSIINENASQASGTNQIWQFGSFAPPNTYDYAVIGMPYSDNLSISSFFNESKDVNLSIPTLYDENWNMVWNRSRGDTSANLSDDFLDYNSSSLYRNYLSAAGVSCSKTDYNLTATPCYVNTTSNTVYMKVPHFSGVGPSMSASGAVATTTTTTDTSSSSGGGATTPESYWTSTRSITDEQLNAGFSQELGAKGRIKFILNGSDHSVGVISLTATTATINVSSAPQQAVFNIGDTKKFDLTNDSYYDVKVMLNGITGGKANVTVMKIYEAIPAPTAAPAAPQTTAEKIQEKIGDIAGKAADKGSLFWIVIIVIVIVIIILGIMIKKKVDYLARKKGLK